MFLLCQTSEFFLGNSTAKESLSTWVIMSMFWIHYGNRSLVYPFQIKSSKPFPLSMTLTGGLYNCLNGYLQGSYLGGVERKPIELSSIHFIIGVLMFCLGMFINLHSDMLLRRLRKPGETAYKIPHGGAFNLVTGIFFFFFLRKKRKAKRNKRKKEK